MKAILVSVITLVVVVLATVFVGVRSGGSPAKAAGVPYAVGDVFAGVGNGMTKHFSASGVLLDTLNSGTGSSETTGMAFDSVGNLYATQYTANTVVKFDRMGNLIGTFGSGYNAAPESIVVNGAGDSFVGQADGTRQVLEFDPSGAPLATFSPVPESKGTDWIDLAADQCTLFYTSEGASVKRFDTCANAQLPDFATGLSVPCFALRIRPNGEVMVACASQVYRLDATGTVIQTYTLPGTSELFALSLDPDRTSFWTGDLRSGRVFKVDISSGAVLTTFNTAPFVDLAGLVVFGEITAGGPTPTPAPALRSCAGEGLDISTGGHNPYGGNGFGLVDPLWTLAATPSGVQTRPAFAVTPDNIDAPPWFPPPYGTNWIDPNNTGGNVSDPAGDYVYQTSFTVPFKATLTLNFTYAVHNNVIFSLTSPSNSTLVPGGTLSGSVSGNFSTPHTVSYNVPASAGTYVLTAKVDNSSGPVGLLVSGGVTCVPIKVGGAVALSVTEGGSPVPWTPLAAVAASMLAVLSVGLWYGRRRWLR